MMAMIATRGKNGNKMRHFNYLGLLLVVIYSIGVFGFVPSAKFQPVRRVLEVNSQFEIRRAASSLAFVLFAKESDSNESEDEEDDEDDIDLGDQDWRAFRAKLVMQKQPETPTDKVIEDEGDLDGIGSVFSSSSTTEETEQTVKSSSTILTPLDPSQWAYDSGNVIEKGAVILGGVEQEYGFGLRQQYFHKALILVLDHEESTFTKGIILNRPTDLTLDDDLNEGVKWRVWFGGDVQGLGSNAPEVVCLHSLKNKTVTDASVSVMKDIQWTSFENAKKLVKKGVASPSDFWVFCGYAGWGPQQLMGELERKSWYMVATDSQTLLQELAKQADGADPRDAGLDTWDLLMRMIGRGETADEYSGDFDDLVLKEWAREHLLSEEGGGGAGGKNKVSSGGLAAAQELIEKIKVDKLMDMVSTAVRSSNITEGTLLRASPAERSPFLLENQALHKSILLVVGEDENLSVGVVLNRPAAKGLDLQITEKNAGTTKTIKLPLRYGGQYAVTGQDPLLWLHCNPRLRAAKVGSDIGGKGAIYKCSSEQVTNAIGQGLAKPQDFLVVSGVTIWGKGKIAMQGEANMGDFEVIPDSQVHGVWNTLKKQEVLTKLNLVSNLALADEAWKEGADKKAKKNGKEKEQTASPISGLGDGFDEEDDSLVFKSDMKVSVLSDDALRSWVATFLLGAPGLGE